MAVHSVENFFHLFFSTSDPSHLFNSILAFIPSLYSLSLFSSGSVWHLFGI